MKTGDLNAEGSSCGPAGPMSHLTQAFVLEPVEGGTIRLSRRAMAGARV